MNVITMMYVVLGVFMLIILGAAMMIIAGKDMFMAFKRLLVKRGSDVYIVNQNRNLSHYYTTPKDYKFKIGGMTYITNPEKTLNLSDIDKMRVINSISKTDQRIKARLDELDIQIKFLTDTSNKQETTENQKLIYRKEIERLHGLRVTFEAKLSKRSNNYFSSKRSAYFYIEGDPVPKDFYEYYSALDCKILDNILSSNLSKPMTEQDYEKQLNLMKILLFVTAIAAVAAAILALRNGAMITGICDKLGAVCNFP